MCIGRKECQVCETCGNRKYQFWVGPDMHDRGCPFGHARMDQCPDALNHAKLLFWAINNGVEVRPSGRAKVKQLLAAGVDLTRPCEEITAS